MKKYFCYLLLLSLLFSCGTKKEIRVTRLKGTKILNMDILPCRVDMRVCDDLLLVAPGRGEAKVIIYDLNTKTLKGKVSIAGIADYEAADLFPIEGDNYICGLHFPFYGDVYGLKTDLSVEKLKLRHYPADISAMEYGITSIGGMDEEEIIFCGKGNPSESKATTYAIWKYGKDKTERLFDMTDGSGCDVYVSSAGIMEKKDSIIVFGYKYHNWLAFINRFTRHKKTIKKNSPGFDIKTTNAADYVDRNPMYYNGSIYFGKNIWLQNLQGYIPQPTPSWPLNTTFIECYSLDACLIKQIELDHYGAFAVDEKRDKIYLVAINNEMSLFEYSM